MRKRYLIIIFLICFLLIGCGKKISYTLDKDTNKEMLEQKLSNINLKLDDVLIDGATEVRLTENKIYFQIDGNLGTYNLWLSQIYDNMKKVADDKTLYDMSENILEKPKDMFMFYYKDEPVNIVLGNNDNVYYIKIDK